MGWDSGFGVGYPTPRKISGRTITPQISTDGMTIPPQIFFLEGPLVNFQGSKSHSKLGWDSVIDIDHPSLIYFSEKIIPSKLIFL